MAAVPNQVSLVAVIGGDSAAVAAAMRIKAVGMRVVMVLKGEGIGEGDLSSTYHEKKGMYLDSGLSPFTFNSSTIKSLASTVKTLDIETKDVSNSYSVSSKTRFGILSDKNGKFTIAGQPQGAAEILKKQVYEFGEKLEVVLMDPKYQGWTLSKYLDSVIASSSLTDHFALPIAAGTVNMPDKHPDDMPLVEMVQYWIAHGLVNSRKLGYTLKGGVKEFCTAVEKHLEKKQIRFRRNSKIKSIARKDGGGVQVNYFDGEGVERLLEADDIIFTGSASDALTSLADITSEEKSILESVPEVEARVVVHTDERFMPFEESLWAAVNYVAPEKTWPNQKPTVTFHLNEYYDLPTNYFLTINPTIEPDEDEVISDNKEFMRPYASDMSAVAEKSVKHLHSAKGNRVWFAGSYLESPYLKDSSWKSGEETANLVISEIYRRKDAGNSSGGCCCF